MKPIIKSEHSEQACVIDFCKRMAGSHPELDLIFAIVNGAALTWKEDARGKRYSPQASKLKAEGLKNGVPDLFLPVPHHGLFGLWIEMKLPGGVVGKEQRDFMNAVVGLGYQATVCRSADEAIETIKEYLGIE